TSARPRPRLAPVTRTAFSSIVVDVVVIPSSLLAIDVDSWPRGNPSRRHQRPPSASSAGTGLMGGDVAASGLRPGRAWATIAPTSENPARTATAGANPSRNASG